MNKVSFYTKILKRNQNQISYATSSCSISTKNRAKQSPGKTKVTIGVKIGGRNDAVIKYKLIKFLRIKRYFYP